MESRGTSPFPLPQPYRCSSPGVARPPPSSRSGAPPALFLPLSASPPALFLPPALSAASPTPLLARARRVPSPSLHLLQSQPSPSLQILRRRTSLPRSISGAAGFHCCSSRTLSICRIPGEGRGLGRHSGAAAEGMRPSSPQGMNPLPPPLQWRIQGAGLDGLKPALQNRTIFFY
jgi:hypothetical protein